MRDPTQIPEGRPLLWVGLVLCAATATIVAWPARCGQEAFEVRYRAITASISGGEREINRSLAEAATLGASQRRELMDDLLRSAVVNGNHASLDALLRVGADVNARGYAQVTPLMLSAIAPDAEGIAEQL